MSKQDPVTAAYAYQRLIDAATTLSEMVAAVNKLDGEKMLIYDKMFFINQAKKARICATLAKNRLAEITRGGRA